MALRSFLGRISCCLAMVLVLLSGCGTAAFAACNDNIARPVIDVKVDENDIVFDTTVSKAGLANMKIDTVSPYPAHYKTEVGGLMSGELGLNHTITLGRIIDPGTNKACLHIKKIKVTLNMKPKIFIANELHDNACWFREIFQHEMKHVEVDRDLAAEYEKRITDALNMLLMEKSDYLEKNIPVKQLEEITADIQSGFDAALEVLFSSMLRERRHVQQAVDSLDEYAGMERICGGATS